MATSGETTDSVVVVGVDGSPGSVAALRFAADDARRRGARLRAVLAWEFPPRIVGGAGWVAPTPELLAQHAHEMRARLDGILADAADALAGVDVEPNVAHAAPVPALLAAAADASLLVVGTRGHGGFAELLLGSVSAQCVQHAPCPVVVVPSAAVSARRAAEHPPDRQEEER